MLSDIYHSSRNVTDSPTLTKTIAADLASFLYNDVQRAPKSQLTEEKRITKEQQSKIEVYELAHIAFKKFPEENDGRIWNVVC